MVEKSRLSAESNGELAEESVMGEVEVCGKLSLIVAGPVFSLSFTRRAFGRHTLHQTLGVRWERSIGARGANSSHVLCGRTSAHSRRLV